MQLLHLRLCFRLYNVVGFLMMPRSCRTFTSFVTRIYNRVSLGEYIFVLYHFVHFLEVVMSMQAMVIETHHILIMYYTYTYMYVQ